MNKDFTKKDLLIIEAKILELNTKKQSFVKRKLEIQSSLSHCQLQYQNVEYNSKDFKEIKERRLILKNSLSQIEIKIKDLNLTIKAEINKRIEIENYIRQNKDVLDSQKDLESVLSKLTILRTKYKNFAKDRTRISSLRVLASEFMDDLDKIIK